MAAASFGVKFCTLKPCKITIRELVNEKDMKAVQH